MFSFCATLGHFFWWSGWASMRHPRGGEQHIPSHQRVCAAWPSVQSFCGRAALARRGQGPGAVWQWSALPMASMLVSRRAGELSLGGSRWPLNVVLPDAVVVCLIISVLLLELSCIHLAREMVWNCHLFSLLLYIVKWTEGGEKISVGSLTHLFEDEQLLRGSYFPVWNKCHVAPHPCAYRRALHLLKLDPTLKLHGWPLRGKFPKTQTSSFPNLPLSLETKSKTESI